MKQSQKNCLNLSLKFNPARDGKERYIVFYAFLSFCDRKAFFSAIALRRIVRHVRIRIKKYEVTVDEVQEETIADGYIMRVG